MSYDSQRELKKETKIIQSRQISSPQFLVGLHEKTFRFRQVLLMDIATNFTLQQAIIR
ncbi:unnamed protein product [Paramecium primaurelia]|uniref:Uncharacterized protein n=1 Tax=Paramecium primaurelia TaxID=5886 RepID=A0A8S1MRP0_PARPR|nr:unnamed protein product [Paramecium primaurelia]